MTRQNLNTSINSHYRFSSFSSGSEWSLSSTYFILLFQLSYVYSSMVLTSLSSHEELEITTAVRFGLHSITTFFFSFSKFLKSAEWVKLYFCRKNTEMILLSSDWSQNVKGEMLLIHVLLIMYVSTRVE